MAAEKAIGSHLKPHNSLRQGPGGESIEAANGGGQEGGGGQENGNAQPQFVCVDGVPGDGSMKDWDGALAQELEACERSGDPANEGVIWPRYESLMSMLDFFWSRGDWRPFLPDLFFFIYYAPFPHYFVIFFLSFMTYFVHRTGASKLLQGRRTESAWCYRVWNVAREDSPRRARGRRVGRRV